MLKRVSDFEVGLPMDACVFFGGAVCIFNGLWQMQGGQDVDGVTNNAGYFVLSFMPLLLLMEKRMAQYFFLSFCIVLIILR